MSNDGVNEQRRRFLTVSTSVVGAVGAVGAAVPFIGSWNPSAKAEAAGAPVKLDISKLEPDAMTSVEWRGFPIFVIRRSQQTLDNLKKLNNRVSDPNPNKPPSSLNTLRTSIAPGRSGRRSWFSRPSAPTWAVYRNTGILIIPRKSSLGTAAFSALAMVPCSIWLAVCIETCQHPRTLRFRPTTLKVTTCLSLDWIHRRQAHDQVAN